MQSNLWKRILFAAWAIPLGWLFIVWDVSLLPASFIPFYPSHLVIIIIIILASSEYTRMLSLFFRENGFWLTSVWLGGMLVLYHFMSDLPTTLELFTLLIVVSLEAIFWGRKSGVKRWKRTSLLFSGTVFLYIAGVAILNFYRDPFQSSFVRPSPFWFSQIGIFIVIGAVFLCDTAAYFVGKFFGKHHFSSLSPKKTVEGMVAGISASILIGATGWYFFAAPSYPRYAGIIMGALIGTSAIIGDLVNSAIKRYFGVKDSSDLIPGHGGILDRFDSLFFTAPILYMFFWVFDYVA